MKRSILSVLTILCFSAGISFSQSYQWARKVGSYGVDFGRAVGTDAQGNVYITGQFEFDGYFNGNNHTSNFTANGTHDIFLAKYDPSGNLVWARKAGGSGGDGGTAIYVDAAGNSYITGEMEGTSYFETTALVCQGSNDIFIAKYNTNGQLVFADKAGGYSGDRGRAIVADASGNVYLTGEFRQTAHFGSITVSTSGIYKDFFLAKYNPSSGWQWVKTGGSSVDDQGQAICLDPAGDVYVAGYHGPNSSFGSTALSSAGGFDMFIAKYSSAGALQWIQRGGGVWDDYGSGLAYNATDNMIYLTGEFRGTSDFGSITMTEAGWGDVFLAGYSPSGMPMWVKSAGGAGATDYARGIALDASNNIYITGAYGKSATFPAAMNGDTSEVFIASFNTSGTLRWVVDAKGSGTEDVGRGIAIDPSGNVIVVGNYNKHLGTATENLNVGPAVLTGFANEDAFVLKYSPVLPSGINDDHAAQITSLFPNPASDLITIQTKNNGLLSIENSFGQVIFKREVNAGASESIDISGLGSGMYFVRFSDEKRKLIKY